MVELCPSKTYGADAIPMAPVKVILFGNRVFAEDQGKRRSYLIEQRPNPM